MPPIRKAASAATSRPAVKLKTTQLRVLAALADGALLRREELCEACGWTAGSGTIRAALNGVREGSSTGNPRPGLIELGLVEVVDLDVDGLVERRWRLTRAGEAEASKVGRLPDAKDKASSTNNRYKNRSSIQ